MAYTEEADRRNPAQDYARQTFPTGRSLGSAANVAVPTAAQEAPASAQRLLKTATELLARLSSLSDRLSASGPESAKDQPRPVHSGGAIGDIHSAIDDIDERVNACHRLMNDIERKV